MISYFLFLTYSNVDFKWCWSTSIRSCEYYSRGCGKSTWSRCTNFNVAITKVDLNERSRRCTLYNALEHYCGFRKHCHDVIISYMSSIHFNYECIIRPVVLFESIVSKCNNKSLHYSIPLTIVSGPTIMNQHHSGQWTVQYSYFARVLFRFSYIQGVFERRWDLQIEYFILTCWMS